jgi:hypothetical protein
VLFGPRTLGQLFKIGAVGRQREGYCRGQLGEGISCARRTDAKSPDHDGNDGSWRVMTRGLDQPRIEQWVRLAAIGVSGDGDGRQSSGQTKRLGRPFGRPVALKPCLRSVRYSGL